MSAPKMCDCDHCRGERAETCACGHSLGDHLRMRFHSCAVCVWCDRFLVPRGGKR